MDEQQTDDKHMNTIYIEVDSPPQGNMVAVWMRQGNGMTWWVQRLKNPSVKRVLKIVKEMNDQAEYMGYSDIVINVSWKRDRSATR